MSKPTPLVPIDYSKDSKHALRYALELAEKLGADVHALHVWECMPHPPKDYQVEVSGGGKRSLFELVEEGAEKEYGEFIADVKPPPSVRFEHSLRSGEPSRAILEFAKAGTYSMIVVGSRGHGAFSHLVLGSVAERVVRLSQIPVLVVPG